MIEKSDRTEMGLFDRFRMYLNRGLIDVHQLLEIIKQNLNYLKQSSIITWTRSYKLYFQLDLIYAGFLLI